MVTETEVVRRTVEWVRANKGQVIQAVYPGGQARFSISYRTRAGDRKTVFPDLILIVRETLIIGEAKPHFSLSDAEKLTDLAGSETAVASIRHLVTESLKLSFVGPPTFALAHADAQAPPVTGVYQLVVPSADVSCHRWVPPIECSRKHP